MGVIFSTVLGYKVKERITPPADKDIKTAPNVDKLLDSSTK